MEYAVLDVFRKADPILMNLNVSSLPDLEGGETADFPQRDFRQDFMYAMVKFGLLDPEAPSRILVIEVEEIPPLLEVQDIVQDVGDMMDDDERLIGRLRSFDGNQSIIVAAILEVTLSRKAN